MSPTCRRRPSSSSSLEQRPRCARRPSRAARRRASPRRAPPRRRRSAPIGGAAARPCRRQRVACGAAACRARAPSEAAPALPQPQSFLEVVELFEQAPRGDAALASLRACASRAFRARAHRVPPGDGAPRDLANRLGKLLGEWTGQRWVVSVSGEEGAPTLREQADARDRSTAGARRRSTRWCARCSRPFPARASRRCASSARAEPAEAEPADSADERSEGDDVR